MKSPMERFTASYVNEPSGCWRWTGYLNWGGYGIFQLNGTSHPAHRAGYLLMVGPIGEKLDLDHLCRNRACVNPDHLEPVTRSENLKRGHVGQWARRKTHCKNGHPLSGPNLYVCRRGRRECRTCRTEASRRFRAREKATA